MCNFFSVISNPVSKQIYYADWELRKRFLSNKIDGSPDSHTTLAHVFNQNEDKCNKYEYNPFTGVFKVDQINGKDDSEDVERRVRAIDFKTICPMLTIKPIVNPFKDYQVEAVTDEMVQLLEEWITVYNPIRYSIRYSIRDSIGGSIWDSFGDSVGVYISSFVDIEYKFNREPILKLWHMGVIPSFDGDVWRLHGKDGMIIYTKELK
jgi:hypothetical protein